jgi:universal stress protein E
MNPIESILVVLDRSDRDQHVCAKATLLARLLNARLELFLCDSERELVLKQSYDPRSGVDGRNACMLEATRYLSSVRANLPLEPAQITTSTRCDSPLYEAICRKVAASRPDLVLKSPDCDHPGCCLSFSDNDWQLAGTCAAPVMFVRGRRWASEPRIGAAIEASSSQGMPLAREIAALAFQIQSCTHGHLEIVSCMSCGPTDIRPELHSRRLHDALEKLPLPKEGVHVLEGDPDITVPRFATERHYDVLVMGALAHREGVAPVVGSLTSRLIEALDCDFVLVKAPGVSSRGVHARVSPQPSAGFGQA